MGVWGFFRRILQGHGSECMDDDLENDFYDSDYYGGWYSGYGDDNPDGEDGVAGNDCYDVFK